MLFWAALVVLVAGSAWCAHVFMDGHHGGGELELGPSETGAVEVFLDGTGYRQVHMPGFAGQALLVRVADPSGNLISDGIVQTRMAVDYFEAGEAGPHSVIVTNVSDEPASVELAVGSADAARLAWPGAAAAAGAALMAAWGCLRAARYITAQPDENST